MPVPASFRTFLLVLTLLVTWFVWGSSFVAIMFALEGIPPLLLMASRFVVAGAIAVAIGLLLARRAGHPMPCARSWRDAAIIGFGFITIGMGATGWSATRLPTGVASLLVASAPVWIVLLQVVVLRTTRPGRFQVGGLLAGMLGVAILVVPGGSSGAIDPVAALVLVASNAAWAAASLFSPRAVAPQGLLLRVGMQMLTGGAVLLAVALAVGEGARFDAGAITASVLGGWAYLVLPAAIGGFASYGWLLSNVSAGTASTHAFVNPLVAVALGALVLGERVDGLVLAAAAAVVGAVVLLLVGESRAVPVAPAATVAGPEPLQPRIPRTAVRSARAMGRPTLPVRSRGGWSPAPTPAFAARRAARPWHATDGMDALAIDEALDRPF